MSSVTDKTRSDISARRRSSFAANIRKNSQLYALVALPLIFVIIFHYVPMYGAQIAFKNFRLMDGISGSPWVGFANFTRFFGSYAFPRVMKNTIGLSLYSLIAGFPFPIILALSLNTLRGSRFKKTVQMVTYAPHFISTVVIVGIVLQLLGSRTGLVNNFLELLGMERIQFLGDARYFRHIYVWSGVWQNVGFGSIIYLAVLSSVDPQLHEAAVVDGASRMQRIWHIDIPGLLPTAVIILILNTGHILNVGFEKVLLLQNPLNLSMSEVIATYVYKVGIEAEVPNYAYSSAIGLFQSVVGLILLVTVNRIAKRLGQTSLW
jgi:putative aldouronate transport system permease protein